MKWQEYQDAVGELYKQMAEFGDVKKNITLPDLITGQTRQIDVWWEVDFQGHKIKVLIDAKKRKDIVDVKDIEEVHMLAKAVNANKAILVTNGQWTKPAEKKAKFIDLDLKLLTIDQATNIIVKDKWVMCNICNNDCVVLDTTELFEVDGLANWFIRGRCRSCEAMYVNCQSCGDKGIITDKVDYTCNCLFTWKINNGVIAVFYPDEGKKKYSDTNQLKLKFDDEYK